jgi:uncharacterized protein YpmB
MKKTIIYSIIILIIVLSLFGASFFISQQAAEKVKENYTGEVSKLKGQLILFKGEKFSPCWVFKGEYANQMTGATFDVYVSLLGTVKKGP